MHNRIVVSTLLLATLLPGILLPGAAALAEQQMITGWKRDPVRLRPSRYAPAVQVPVRSLPPQVPVTARDGDFLRFQDPRTGAPWFVNVFDVDTNEAPAARDAQGPRTACLTYGAMGAIMGCTP